MDRTILILVVVAVLLTAVLVGTQLFSPSQPTELAWLDDYDHALELAGEEDLPILLYLHTDWCGYCRRMNATTLVDPAVISEIGPAFVWLKLDAEKNEQGVQLRDRFGVNAYPAMILLDSEGKEIDRLQGYIGPDRFALDLRTQLTSPFSMAALRSQLAETPDAVEVHFQMGRKLLSRNQFGDAVRHFARVLDLDPDNSRGLSDEGLFLLGQSLGRIGETEASLDTVTALRKRFPQSQHIPDALVLKAEMLLVAGDTQQANAVLQSFLTEYPSHEYTKRIRQFLSQRAPAAMPAASH